MTTVVLTGPVHIGKTTVCRQVADWAQQHGFRVRGILTPPILDASGACLGIEVLDVESRERRELARVDCDWGGPCVGPYHFDPAALEWGQNIVASAIITGCDLLIVDEIGRLELEQGAGFQRVLPLLATGSMSNSLIVVRDTLLDAFRRHLPDLETRLFEVTLENRNALHMEIVELIFDVY